MGLEAQVRAVGDAGVHGPGVIAGVEHLLQRRLEQLRQALPARRLGARQRGPATLDIGAIGLDEAVRGADLARLPPAALAVTLAVQRRQHALTEARRLFQHLERERQVQGLERRAAAPRVGCLQPVLKHKLHIAQRRLIAPHRHTSSTKKESCASSAIGRVFDQQRHALPAAHTRGGNPVAQVVLA